MKCYQSSPVECVSLVVGVFIFDVADKLLRGVIPPLEMTARKRHETYPYIHGRVIDVLLGNVADALVFDTGLVSAQIEAQKTQG